MIMKNLELILLFILAFTFVVHVFPFVKGFYAGYMDAKNGRPFNENIKDRLNNDT